jgi:hypothetical protein
VPASRGKYVAMIKKSLGVVLALAVGVAVKVGWPDMKRYLKIKQVSAQRMHPEMVPAQGRTAYPQRSCDGAADGTGDFDSAQRGGPARS